MTTIKEILYVLLDNYAEHEIGFLPEAVNTDEQGFRKERKYANKIVAPTLGPVDYAALVLIGGYGWMTAEADGVVPIVKQALSKGIIVGGICNAVSWMAKQGLLNNIKHTGNGIDQLKLWGGDNYTNEGGYLNEQIYAICWAATLNRKVVFKIMR